MCCRRWLVRCPRCGTTQQRGKGVSLPLYVTAACCGIAVVSFHCGIAIVVLIARRLGCSHQRQCGASASMRSTCIASCDGWRRIRAAACVAAAGSSTTSERVGPSGSQDRGRGRRGRRGRSGPGPRSSPRPRAPIARRGRPATGSVPTRALLAMGMPNSITPVRNRLPIDRSE